MAAANGDALVGRNQDAAVLRQAQVAVMPASTTRK